MQTGRPPKINFVILCKKILLFSIRSRFKQFGEKCASEEGECGAGRRERINK